MSTYFAISHRVDRHAKEVFEFYADNLQEFLDKTPNENFFDFTEGLHIKYYAEHEKMKDISPEEIAFSDITVNTEKIDRTRFYLGLMTFIKSLYSDKATESPIHASAEPGSGLKALPLEAFKYEGHNMLDIKENNKTYVSFFY